MLVSVLLFNIHYTTQTNRLAFDDQNKKKTCSGQGRDVVLYRFLPHPPCRHCDWTTQVSRLRSRDALKVANDQTHRNMKIRTHKVKNALTLQAIQSLPHPTHPCCHWWNQLFWEVAQPLEQRWPAFVIKVWLKLMTFTPRVLDLLLISPRVNRSNLK